jgi:hypothetical protein
LKNISSIRIESLGQSRFKEKGHPVDYAMLVVSFSRGGQVSPVEAVEVSNDASHERKYFQVQLNGIKYLLSMEVVEYLDQEVPSDPSVGVEGADHPLAKHIPISLHTEDPLAAKKRVSYDLLYFPHRFSLISRRLSTRRGILVCPSA